MKKIRLLLTEECDRNCSGCCNHHIKPTSEITTSEFLKGVEETHYNEIILTGGEPLLFPEKLKELLKEIFVVVEPNVKIILYTAHIKNLIEVVDSFLEYMIDSVTLTIHEQSDVEDFYKLNEKNFNFTSKPRLNVFTGVVFDKPVNLKGWDVKFVKWIENCPLPENEELVKLKDF
jgi:organic radical activating enzyme